MEILSELTKNGAVQLDGLFIDTPLYVTHGANASFARPGTTRPVIWHGTVEPNNMLDGDEFIDLSGVLVIDGGTP